MFQKCSICKIDKQLSEFYIRKESGNHRKDCKECMGKRKIELQKKNTIINKEKLKTIDKTQVKTCSNCNKEKQLSEFSISPANKTGFYSWCLICSRKKYKNQKKNIIQYTKNDVKKCTKCNTTKNIFENFRIKHSKDGYSNICKECDKKYSKSVAKELYQKKKHKLATNIQYKLSENIRSRLRILLGNIKIKKPNTEKLIDCNLDDFTKHLTKLFYKDISFDNYGTTWHLDHIIPCDWFDLTDVNQLKACTHYTNLQPLLINDNSVKSNKLDWIHPKSGYKITFLRLIYNKFIKLPKLI
jgi:hypothetical protein